MGSAPTLYFDPIVSHFQSVADFVCDGHGLVDEAAFFGGGIDQSAANIQIGVEDASLGSPRLGNSMLGVIVPAIRCRLT